MASHPRSDNPVTSMLHGSEQRYSSSTPPSSPSAYIQRAVGNARIEGLIADLHMSEPHPSHTQRVSYQRSKQAGEQFLIAITIYIVGFVLFEVPCNILLKLTTPRFWLPTLALAWGVITTLTGVTQNFPGFVSARCFLGIVEGGLIPGCIFYMSMWYKRNEQNYRIALLLSTATLAGAFGGIFVSDPCRSPHWTRRS